MEKSASELTTTLHLGSRTDSEGGTSALLEKLLADSSAEEREVLTSIIDGDGKNAMVFIHKGPSRGARFLITSDGATIGRSPASDIFLDDITVSRLHGKISSIASSEGSGFLYTDLGSLNGSYINNQQLSSHSLVTGDEIQIGKFHMLFIGAGKNQGRNK